MERLAKENAETDKPGAASEKRWSRENLNWATLPGEWRVGGSNTGTEPAVFLGPVSAELTAQVYKSVVVRDVAGLQCR